MKIAVDAMGGDYAPDRIVEGAVEAAASARGAYGIVLVGDRDRLADTYARPLQGLPIEIEHAGETVEMKDEATVAIRRKRDASIAVAMRLHRQGKVDAVVSAGHTGAVMATALLTLGRVRGVSRPAIAIVFPSASGATLILDVGANPDCRAQNLLEFAIMGSLYAEHVFGIPAPRVGLISNGEEQNKGTEAVVEAHRLLLNSGLHFVGNIQGRDILTGDANVVVCDGFTGNVLLKFTEGVMTFLSAGLKRGLVKSPLARLGALLMSPVFQGLKRDLDYEEYGGAPLLGVNGVVIICHGRSTAKAIRNAIQSAARTAGEGLNQHIQARLDQMHSTRDSG